MHIEDAFDDEVIDQVVIPVHATLEATAKWEAEADRDDGGSVACLRLPLGSAARGVYDRFTTDPSQTLVGVARAWFPLDGDLADVYDVEHEGHPLVTFDLFPLPVGKSMGGQDPCEALSFRVCAQCEGPFMALTSRLGSLGVLPAEDDGQESDPEEGDASTIVPVAVDPGQAGYAELTAWRRVYCPVTDAATPPD